MKALTFKDDLVSSVQNWRFWVSFAWLDVINANIRTRSGIILFPLLAAIWIVSIGVLFGDILGEGRQDYMAYVGIGYVAFTFLSGCITASYGVFNRNLKIIQNMRIGILNFPFRETARFFFQMLLQCVTLIIVFYFLDIKIGINALYVIPGMITLALFGLGLTLLFAIIGTYLPDFAALTSSFMRLMFFVTPIWWYPGSKGGTRALIAEINPFTHFMRLFRAPILENTPPPPLTLFVVGLSTILVLTIASVAFAITRRHIILRL